MTENFLKQNRLNINCSIACLVSDEAGFLDQYDSVNLNCGIYLASSEMNAKLLAKGTNINCGQTVITDYQGDFVQVADGIVGDGADYSGVYVVASGDLFLQGEGVRAFEKSAGAIVSGTVYYPASCPAELLNRVQANKRPYPEDAHIVLKSCELKQLVSQMPAGVSRAWVAGEVSAFDESALRQAVERGLKITCDRLFISQTLYDRYQSLFDTMDSTIVPDGFAVTGPLTLNQAVPLLYGKKLYVRGPLVIEEKNADCLSEFESILVKGTVSLPISCAKAFKAVGEADHYKLYEGTLYHINGWEILSHDCLDTMVKNGEKLTMSVDGFVIFSDDVTSGDMDAIASLHCNGFIIVPGAAQGALSQKIDGVNGFTIDSTGIQKMTGMDLQQIIEAFVAGNNGNINTQVYLLK